MCGIAGFQGHFDPGLLDRMGDILAHRGPDDSGVYFNLETSTGLAHRRLSIIDLSSAGHQPMWDSAQKCVITFNGEIYNYRELRNDLEALGYRFTTASDTEVLLNLYLSDGYEMLQKLNGIFAFAIFDKRDKALFIARDGFGIKPLYYSQTSLGFIFASELKALLLEPMVSREIDPRAALAYLTYLWCPAPLTMLQCVKKLEPGYALKIQNGSIKTKWQFYELPYDQEIATISSNVASAQVRQTLESAVQRQLVSDAPLGAFLSGGMDSSSLVAIARKFNPKRDFQCFNAIVSEDGSQVDGFESDYPYALLLSKKLDITLHCTPCSEIDPSDLPSMIYYLDEPQADPAPLLISRICNMARKSGIKVLLSGAGGDDILSGYRRHHALLLEKYWGWWPVGLRRLLRLLTTNLPMGNSFCRRVHKAFENADLGSVERMVGYFSWINRTNLSGLLGPKLQEELDVNNLEDLLLQSLRRLPNGVEPLNKMLFLESKHFLTDHNLNYVDKMGMSEGVEIRVPFLDRDLVKLAARLPVKFKQRGSSGKWILKKAMESYLPRELLQRNKTGFGPSARTWMMNTKHEIFEDVFSRKSIEARGLFQFRAVQEMRRNNDKQLIDASYPLLAIACIEIWFRTFIDSPIPSIVR